MVAGFTGASAAVRPAFFPRGATGAVAGVSPAVAGERGATSGWAFGPGGTNPPPGVSAVGATGRRDGGGSASALFLPRAAVGAGVAGAATGDAGICRRGRLSRARLAVGATAGGLPLFLPRPVRAGVAAGAVADPGVTPLGDATRDAALRGGRAAPGRAGRRDAGDGAEVRSSSAPGRAAAPGSPRRAHWGWPFVARA